ncbi:hypothetical protein GCM10011320_11570 [Neoroseomonas lacus]|uniref:OmpA-like domain-containing protein n=2 Tax=Neoroseomonas lacus TaxID=287609 RepID=A0A917KAF6_9PROT|nr:hypothetical protein GCM10011320_11570 [Neoroseomonas lacus]
MAPAQMGRVDVIGHIDGAEVQRGLSIVGEQRARAVAEWLIAAGISRGLVRLCPVNVRDMLVPTPPGVAEPWNRWTEVVRQ